VLFGVSFAGYNLFNPVRSTADKDFKGPNNAPVS
jgi:hypothetical protein